MKQAEIVEGMLGLLDSPEHWCKDVLTQTGEGGDTQYCLMGALNMTAYGHPYGIHPIPDKTWPAVRQLARTMDELAVEKGYRYPGYPQDHLGSGAHAVCFNNAPEVEYEDLRLFLKETLERVS